MIRPSSGRHWSFDKTSRPGSSTTRKFKSSRPTKKADPGRRRPYLVTMTSTQLWTTDSVGFYAVARLDPERYQRDFAKLAAEVIANLAGFLGTDIEISVEIKATNPEGFPDHVTRTVTENARTLRLDSYGFETE